MLKRIVKMHFRSDAVPEFLGVFSESGHLIRAFQGCHYLELLRDTDRPQIFFTVSIWENEAALEAYRQSELFQRTWALTKSLFAERATAWSTRSEVLLA